MKSWTYAGPQEKKLTLFLVGAGGIRFWNCGLLQSESAMSDQQWQSGFVSLSTTCIASMIDHLALMIKKICFAIQVTHLVRWNASFALFIYSEKICLTVKILSTMEGRRILVHDYREWTLTSLPSYKDPQVILYSFRVLKEKIKIPFKLSKTEKSIYCHIYLWLFYFQTLLATSNLS